LPGSAKWPEFKEKYRVACGMAFAHYHTKLQICRPPALSDI